MTHLLLRGGVLARHRGPESPPRPPIVTLDRPPCSIEAVLFDKDGTLCHSEPRLVALAQARVGCCQRLLRERHPQLWPGVLSELGPRLEATYGLQGDTIHPAGTTAVASREHNLISTATALAQLGLGWPEALDLAEAVFDHCDGPDGGAGGPAPRATAGLHSLLHQLNRAGVACAVISNDERPGIECFLAAENLRGCFQALRSAEQRPRKPDPGAVLALCSELGVEPDRCALIGDANSDLRMAEQAGVGVVLGYSAGWRQRPPLDGRYAQLARWQELEARCA
ncbi:MAG: HAD-IA family hydrolase [Cyanobacteria bacterium J06638_7]